MFGGDIKEYQKYVMESIIEDNIRLEIDENIQGWPKSAHGLKWKRNFDQNEYDQVYRSMRKQKVLIKDENLNNVVRKCKFGLK
jgi:uncharacterized protein YdcH (DUF465 family)